MQVGTGKTRSRFEFGTMKKELAEIKDKLGLLKRLDKRFQIVGANQHHYYSYVPDEVEVEVFEKAIDIKLPNTFRDFLREIGYGAGPYDGLWTLEQIRDEQNYLQLEALRANRSISPNKPFPLDDEKQARKVAEAWQDWKQTPSSLYVQSPANGCIPLHGSGTDSKSWIFLVPAGTMTGSIWHGSSRSDWLPASRPLGTLSQKAVLPLVKAPLQFHEWYLSWLEQAIADINYPA